MARIYINHAKYGLVIQSYNPSILEAEVGVEGQPGLQNDMERMSALGMDALSRRVGISSRKSRLHGGCAG